MGERSRRVSAGTRRPTDEPVVRYAAESARSLPSKTKWTTSRCCIGNFSSVSKSLSNWTLSPINAMFIKGRRVAASRRCVIVLIERHQSGHQERIAQQVNIGRITVLLVAKTAHRS